MDHRYAVGAAEVLLPAQQICLQRAGLRAIAVEVQAQIYFWDICVPNLSAGRPGSGLVGARQRRAEKTNRGRAAQRGMRFMFSTLLPRHGDNLIRVRHAQVISEVRSNHVTRKKIVRAA